MEGRKKGKKKGLGGTTNQPYYILLHSLKWEDVPTRGEERKKKKGGGKGGKRREMASVKYSSLDAYIARKYGGRGEEERGGGGKGEKEGKKKIASDGQPFIPKHSSSLLFSNAIRGLQIKGEKERGKRERKGRGERGEKIER